MSDPPTTLQRYTLSDGEEVCTPDDNGAWVLWRDVEPSSLVRSSSSLRTLVERLDAVQGELDRAKREITSPADDRLIRAMEILLAALLSPVEGRQPPLCVDAKDTLD